MLEKNFQITKTPHLKGPRLELRPFSEEFLTAEYVAWLNNPVVIKYSEQRHRSHTLETCRDYFNAMQKNGHLFWAIVTLENNNLNIVNSDSKNKTSDNPTLIGNHIGNLTAYIDSNNKIADLAIMIGNLKYQGRGIGCDAWQLASDYLLSKGGFRKITAGTMSCNEPMLKIFNKTGMRIEGKRERQFLIDDKAYDLIYAASFSENAV